MNPPIHRSTRLGELLIELGYLSRSQLDAVLERQEKKPPPERIPLGRICVEMGLLSKDRLEFVLDRWGKRLRLGELLLNRGTVSAAQIEEALSIQKKDGGRLGEILLGMGAIDEETLAETLGEQFDLPFVPLAGLVGSADLSRYVNALYATRHQVVPIRRLGRHLTVAIADPTRREVARDLERSTGLKVRLVLATPSEIASFARQIYEFERPDGRVDDPRPTPSAGGVEPDLLGTLVARMIELGTRDLHLDAESGGGRARVRLGGELKPLEGIGPLSDHLPGLIRLLKSLAHLDPGERRRPQEGSFAVAIDGEGTPEPVSLHVAVMPGPHGESAHLRRLERKQAGPTLEEVGLSAGVAARFEGILKGARGIVLIAGPPGSGKRSTLRASLSVLRRPEAKILTVEDPIVFVQEGIVQAQVDRRIGNTYATYLMSFLKQDPDAILLDTIGERDACEIAFATGGHGPLIVGTIRANNATDVIAGLSGIGIDGGAIASSLTAVLGQRLVRRNCPHCTRPYEPGAMVLEQWFRGAPPSPTGLRGAGCDACGGTGFSGRVAVAEIWVPSAEEELWISGGIDPVALREKVLRRIRCLGQDALEQAMEGRITLEEATKAVPHGDVVFTRTHGLERGKEMTGVPRLHRAA